MSSILEALKKLDRERVQPKDTKVDIEQEILRSPSSPGVTRSKYGRLLLTLIGSIAVLLLVLLFVWWQPFSVGNNSREPLVSRHKVPSPDASKTGRLPIPVPDYETQTAVVDENRVKPSPPASDPMALQSARPLSVGQDKPALGNGIKAAVASSQQPTPSAKSSETAPVQRVEPKPPARPLPQLSVSGIAYGEQRNSRLAMVNGQALTIGGVIDGVKVVDILEDRVHFSYQGKRFSLEIGTSTGGR